MTGGLPKMAQSSVRTLLLTFSLWLRFPRRGLLVGLATLALVAAACGGDKKEAADDLAETSLRPDAGAPIVVGAGEPVVIGVSVPLTGPDAVVGKEDLAGVLVAVERWKARNGAQLLGHDIEVRAEDDGCTEAEVTREAAERLLRRRGLVGVLGPDCSAGAEAAIPVYASAGIVAISGSATRTDLTTAQPEGGFFFRTAYRNDLQGTLIGLLVGKPIVMGIQAPLKSALL